jgi:hypothetical protein
VLLEEESVENMKTFNERCSELFAVLLSLLPAYLVLKLIRIYGVNVPYWDEWQNSVLPYVRGDLLALRFGRFWQLTNEHRNFIPQILGLIIAHLTALNMKALLYFNLLLIILMLAAVYAIFRRTTTAPRPYLILPPFSFLIFSMMYWPRWIDPRPRQVYIAILGLLGAIWIISSGKKDWKTIIIAAALCYLSSLSFFTGNITWIVIAGMMLLLGYKEKRYYIAWGIIALTVYVPYILDFLQSNAIARRTPPPAWRELIQATLAVIGSPLAIGMSQLSDTAGIKQATTIGAFGIGIAIILSLVIWFFIEEGRRKVVPWLTLIAWIGTSAVAAAYGRVTRFGVGVARSTRYMIYGTLFWMTIAALLGLIMSEPRRVKMPSQARWLFSVIPILVGTLMGISYINGHIDFFQNVEWSRFHDNLIAGRECLRSYQTASDACLERLYPEANLVRSVMPELTELDVSFLKEEQVRAGTSSTRSTLESDASAPTRLTLNDATVDALDPGATNEQTRTFDGQSYEILFQHAPSAATWTVHLEDEESPIFLETGVMVEEPAVLEADPSDGVLFVVDLEGDGTTERLFSEVILPGEAEQQFIPVEIDLSAFAGETVELTLSTEPGEDDDATSNYDWSLWLIPEIVYR